MVVGVVVCMCVDYFKQVCVGDRKIMRLVNQSLFSFSSEETYSPPSPDDHNAISLQNNANGVLQNSTDGEDTLRDWLLGALP